jgi:hypothetical protein
LISSERAMLIGTQPLAIGSPLIGATMNHPASAATKPRRMPHSHIGQAKRGISSPNNRPHSPAQKARSTTRGTPKGGTGCTDHAGPPAPAK